MKNQDKATLADRKAKIESRNDPKALLSSGKPVLSRQNATYSVSARTDATAYGGVALAAELFQAVGLPREIDESLHLLQRHRPYHESDHVLSLALAVFCGARRLDDLEEFRTSTAFLNAIGAARIPDPTYPSGKHRRPVSPR